MKDNICTIAQFTTGGSHILSGYRSPFVAECVQKLEDAGAVVSQKTELDEFGMGSNSTNTAFGSVSNVYADDISAGGSSGGSAVAVASQACFAALGTDTGGSVRLPAAYNGVVGFKPSYGAISRWGVISYANSLDTVGILAKSVGDVATVFAAMKGKVSSDPTYLTYEERHSQERRKYRIGVPLESNTPELSPLMRKAWSQTLSCLLSAGHSLHTVSLPNTPSALSAYYVLAPAEASSNLAKYDGARYGKHSKAPRAAGQVLYAQTRGQLLGEEVRRRILLGTFSLSAGAMDNYYLQAQKVRRLVQQDFDRIFDAPNPLIKQAGTKDASFRERVDVIVMPTSQSLPPKLEDLRQGKGDAASEYAGDVLTVPASLAGLPAISVPVEIPGEFKAEAGPVQAVGMQLVGQIGCDTEVLRTAEEVERICGLRRAGAQ